MLIAQFSDTHIKHPGQLAYGRVGTADMLREALAHLHNLPQRPDLLVITGDLVDAGSAAEYEHLKSLLEPSDIPLVLIPGNHDERETLRAVFPDQPASELDGFWQFALSRPEWPLRIIGLDTVVPQQSGGLLCAQRLRWLDTTLSEATERPTLVLMHHPPFDTGIGHMDDIGLQGRDGFADILWHHPQVRLVVCGHLHRTIRSTVGGRAVMTAPSTAHTVQLDLARDAAAMFRMEPPAFLLHWWSGRDLVSHHVPIGAFSGPHPFFDDNGRLIA